MSGRGLTGLIFAGLNRDPPRAVEPGLLLDMMLHSDLDRRSISTDSPRTGGNASLVIDECAQSALVWGIGIWEMGLASRFPGLVWRQIEQDST